MRTKHLLWASFSAIAAHGYSITHYDSEDGICDGEVLSANVQLDPNVCYKYHDDVDREVGIWPDESDARDFAVNFYGDDSCSDLMPESMPQGGCVGPSQYSSFKVVKAPKVSSQNEKQTKKTKRGAHGHKECSSSGTRFTAGAEFTVRGKRYRWIDHPAFPELKGKILGSVEISPRRRSDINDPGFDLRSLKARNPPPEDPEAGPDDGPEDECEEADVTDCRIVPQPCEERPDRPNEGITLEEIDRTMDDRIFDLLQTAGTIVRATGEVIHTRGTHIYDFIKKNPLFSIILTNSVSIGMAAWTIKSGGSKPDCQNWEITKPVTRGYSDKVNFWRQAVRDLEANDAGGRLGFRFANDDFLSLEMWWEALHTCRPAESVPELNNYCDSAPPGTMSSSDL